MDLSSIVGQSVKNIFFQDGKEDKVSLRQHSQRESLPPEPSLVIRKQVIWHSSCIYWDFDYSLYIQRLHFLCAEGRLWITLEELLQNRIIKDKNNKKELKKKK